MNHFSIRDIENLCGIRAHTLRTWEQRYSLFVAKRKESRRRVYDNEDLKELLRISFLYHQGYKISRIASLSCEQIREKVAAIAAGDEGHELFIHQLIDASIDFDRERFDKIINTLVIRTGLEKAILHVFYPFLQRIGMLWMTNHVIPAQEHFCSHIIRKKIICAIDGIERSNRPGPAVLIFAPSGEFHEIPLLAANYFLRKNNVRTIYFGVDLSLKCLCGYLRQHPVEYLYTHIITQLDDASADHYLDVLYRLFPEKKILLSGPAVKLMKKPPPQVKIFRAPEELIAFAAEAGH